MEISLKPSLNKMVTTIDTEVLDAEKANLLIEVKKVKSQLADAYNNFNYVADPLMVDYYTYQIKAYETMFEYLIKKAKSIGLSNI